MDELNKAVMLLWLNALAFPPGEEDIMPHHRHFYVTGDGLKIMFTLDGRQEGEYWHLSISRQDGTPSDEEAKRVVKAFFPRDHGIVLEGPNLGFSPYVRHFFCLRRGASFPFPG